MTNLINDAKGQFAQMLVATLLEAGGYRVLRFGVEELVSELKASVARREGWLDLPPQLRRVPDHLVINVSSGETRLVETKFRSHLDSRTLRDLHTKLREQQEFWPDTVTVLITPNPPVGNGVQYQDYVRVVPPDELNALDGSSLPAKAWQRLPTLGTYFQNVHDCDGFHAAADSLIQPIRAWG